jgi:hypothetical protein
MSGCGKFFERHVACFAKSSSICSGDGISVLSLAKMMTDFEINSLRTGL